MATVVDTTQLDGLFKERYADEVENLVPDSAKLINDIDFSEGDRLGNTYNQPVILTNEHGVTYAGPDAGAFTLNESVALTMKNASVPDYQMVLRSQMSYDAAYRAVAGGEAAFESSVGLLVANMAEGLGKRLEISTLYGQEGIGVASTYTNVSGTETTLQITTASWATGIWAGSEGATLDAYNSGNLEQAKANSNAALVVKEVDVANRTVTVTGNSSDITAIEAIMAGSPASDSITLFFEGSGYSGSAFNEMPGISKIITNTGTLFGISAASYNLWKGNVQPYSSGALSLARILDSVALAVQRGLNEDVKCYVNPDTWDDLNADEAALRTYDQSYRPGEAVRGNESITYHGQNGKIEVVPHNIVKEADAFVLPVRHWKRIGSTDVTFRNPGRGGDFFRELDDKAGFELRSYTGQSVFTHAPARSVKITGFVNA